MTADHVLAAHTVLHTTIGIRAARGHDVVPHGLGLSAVPGNLVLPLRGGVSRLVAEKEHPLLHLPVFWSACS